MPKSPLCRRGPTQQAGRARKAPHTTTIQGHGCSRLRNIDTSCALQTRLLAAPHPKTSNNRITVCLHPSTARRYIRRDKSRVLSAAGTGPTNLGKFWAWRSSELIRKPSEDDTPSSKDVSARYLLLLERRCGHSFTPPSPARPCVPRSIALSLPLPDRRSPSPFPNNFLPTATTVRSAFPSIRELD